jgi:nucleotide-binding universal stress UspA family protein
LHNPTTTQALKWYEQRSPHTKAYDRYLMKQLIGSTVADVSLKERVGYDAVLGALQRQVASEVNWAEVQSVGTIGIDEVAHKKGRKSYRADFDTLRKQELRRLRQELPKEPSSIAEQTLEPALALAEAMSAELIFLRVTTVPQIVVQSVPDWPGLDAVMEAAGQEANAYLQGVQAALEHSSVSTLLRVAAGPAAEVIIGTVDKQKVDLIVMCSHGRSGIERWLFGSVAEKVLRGANCVTLVIQGQEISK